MEPFKLFAHPICYKIPKIEGGVFADLKNFQEKSHSAENELEGDPFNLVRFCLLFKNLKLKGGPFAITWMRFPGIRFVEQTEQLFCRFESVLKRPRRERLESAPYLKLKKLKLIEIRKVVKGGTLWVF